MQEDITPIALWSRAAVIMQSIRAAIPSAPPTIWETILKISSPFEYVGSSRSANLILLLINISIKNIKNDKKTQHVVLNTTSKNNTNEYLSQQINNKHKKFIKNYRHFEKSYI